MAARAQGPHVSRGRDPGSDQERVLEQDEGRAFAGGTISMDRSIEGSGNARERRSIEDDGDGVDRRDVPGRRPGDIRGGPIAVRGHAIAAILGLDRRAGGLLFRLLGAAAFGAQQAVDPAAEHHLRRQTHQQQKGGRERRRFLPKAIPL
jgi:hypothetical protein